MRRWTVKSPLASLALAIGLLIPGCRSADEPFIDTPAGRVAIGAAWDDALPRLKTVTRVSSRITSQWSAVDVYRLPAFSDDVEIVWAKPTDQPGPLRIERIHHVRRQ